MEAFLSSSVIVSEPECQRAFLDVLRHFDHWYVLGIPSSPLDCVWVQMLTEESLATLPTYIFFQRAPL